MKRTISRIIILLLIGIICTVLTKVIPELSIQFALGIYFAAAVLLAVKSTENE